MTPIKPVAAGAGDLTELAAAIEAAAWPLNAIWARAPEIVQSRVSAPQARALRAIDQHGPLNLNRLADELGVMPSSASRLCDRLVAAGLINRAFSETSRREITLTLRPAGSQLLAALQAARRAEIAAVLGGMSPAGVHALLYGLREFAAAQPANQHGKAI
jgi:DNA-binding MarR family transcriptional regulator